MIQRPLMTPDELKSVPKGTFIVMKTGTRPMRTKLRLFLEWGITFGEPYLLPERAARKVAYADKKALMRNIQVATVNDEAQSVGTYQVGLRERDGRGLLLIRKDVRRGTGQRRGAVCRTGA